MPYKHRETGEYYDISRYSNFHGKVSQSFRPWNKNLETIEFSFDWSIDTNDKTLFPNGTPIEKIWEANDINNAPLEKKINEVFEFVELGPVINVTDKPKYIKVIVEMNCPLCGSPLKRVGGALLSSPLQFTHECSNTNCNYHTTTTRWYAGQEVWAISKEDAYRIITEGSSEEQDELEKRRIKN